MRRWADRVGLALSAFFVLTYVGAKVHFYSRFDASNVDRYVAEHWPFWLALTVIAGLLFVLGRLGRLTNGRGGK